MSTSAKPLKLDLIGDVPDLSSLAIRDSEDGKPLIPDDIANSDDPCLKKLANFARALPYAIESNAKMQQVLDFILLRLVQCIEAKDFDPGLQQWDGMLTSFLMLRYPIPKPKRIKLAKLYFHVATTPGMPISLVILCVDTLKTLIKSKKKLTVEDMRLPWRPLYDIISEDLFLRRRQFEYQQLTEYMGEAASSCQRFFHPAAINEMLSTFVPLINGTSLDSILSSQYYLLTFLPITHPQSYLPMLFRLWESINSYIYDDRMLHFLSLLAELHVDPSASDPADISSLPDDERSEGEGRPQFDEGDLKQHGHWTGLFKDVGLFTEHEWNLLMCKCLASMEIPLADAGSLTTGPSADNQASFEIERLPKPHWRIESLAKIIVYSMAPDGASTHSSRSDTPVFTPLPSGMNTPQIDTTTVGDYLSSPLGKGLAARFPTYIAGCKALDSLARLIASTESFFHPSNSGAWTSDLTAFIKEVVYEFNKRWHEELSLECKTPLHRRLTKQMKRELVKSLRTVVLLAMFSQDSETVLNIKECLQTMSYMEPDLILHPVLERAVPSLEALVETQRTIAVIKALGAVAPAIASREVYYPGAKSLVPILQLLIPGIDLNDPSKTLCTTEFLVEVSRRIKFGDLTLLHNAEPVQLDSEPVFPATPALCLPSPADHEPNGFAAGTEPRLPNEQEDALLIDTTRNFAGWVDSFMRRVIQLIENLPEEGADGSGSGMEVEVMDDVIRACGQICVHLSTQLYDRMLDMVFDFASNNVRSNAVRAIHQLVECVANADPAKTLARFFPFCSRNVRIELENGASSLRTTSASSPLPSDATLHWNLAILRGAVYNEGKVLLPYREELLSLFRLLRDKTFSKRGFSWSGKLLSGLLLTLTHTYPLENKFVNQEEWDSDEFRQNHHRYWGKLHGPGEVKVMWHVPDAREIDFALQIFKELIEPTLSSLEHLLEPDVARDADWRNDFCRYLSFVRNAFAGIPTLVKEHISQEEQSRSKETCDILDEIPEMMAVIEPINSGFCLTDSVDPRYQYITSLRRRFGEFLHRASVSLRQQGEENTVDAVDMLVRAVRTYMLEYGDSRDAYSTNKSQYESEVDFCRQYPHQKLWPRSIYIRRARYYHSVRLRWNSADRRRGPLEDLLIDDVVEWGLWHYAIIRETSQSLLQDLCDIYDGVRRRAFPVLFKALGPGNDDDRMKGALWTINVPAFGRYALTEHSLVPDLFKRLFGCQDNDKPSVQDCVTIVLDDCLKGFSEPSFSGHDVNNVPLNRVLASFKACLPYSADEVVIANRCRERSVGRRQRVNESIAYIVSFVLDIANSTHTHWRYAIPAIRCLRTLARRDVPLTAEHVRFFANKTYDSHPTIRYYAQRGVSKILRNIKLRTFCPDPADLVLGINHNPLKQSVPIQPSHEFTNKFFEDYRKPFDQSSRKPIFCDKISRGWLAWEDTIELYKPAHPTQSTFRPWDIASENSVNAVREIAKDPAFWKSLSSCYAEENQEVYISQDNASCVKSIFQLLDDEPFELLKPILETLMASAEPDQQRGAAELLAGLLGGSKHWPSDAQKRLWEWFTPLIRKTFSRNIKTDTLLIWRSFIQYMFYNKDPRRVQPLMDYLIEEFNNTDYNGESSFDAIKILSLFRAVYQELNWKFSAWIDEVVERCWPEISGEHEDVRSCVGEILAFSSKIKWRPQPTKPTTEVFVRECRLVPIDNDIMGVRGKYHLARVHELVEKFKVWRKEREPGVRAFQSTYDRVGITILKWLFQSLHDFHAIATFDYILPLMPEIFRFTELSDNDELASRADVFLVRMCGVTPPRSMIDPLLDAIFDAIQTSPSWRVRLKALPLVQVFYFRQVPLISEIKIVQILEVVCKCLDDEVIEVREMAATTLSGILRLSPRRSMLTLKDRFVRLAKNSHIPARNSPAYAKAVREQHAAILGVCALVDSYPYTVEKWMPELLTDVLSEHTYDPIPISTTVRKCASNFKKTHQDTWHEDSKLFNEDQMAALSTLLAGSSYCEFQTKNDHPSSPLTATSQTLDRTAHI